jgi:hypothetical protein
MTDAGMKPGLTQRTPVTSVKVTAPALYNLRVRPDQTNAVIVVAFVRVVPVPVIAAKII